MLGDEILFVVQLLDVLFPHCVRIFMSDLDCLRIQSEVLVDVVMRIVLCRCDTKVVHEAHARTL